MSPEEKIEAAQKLIDEAQKLIDEARAEFAAKRRNWPEKIAAGMLFAHQNAIYITAYPGGDGRLVLVQVNSTCRGWMNGTRSGFLGFDGKEEEFRYLGFACDLIKIANDAHEPTAC